jgi:hypothetical protein
MHKSCVQPFTTVVAQVSTSNHNDLVHNYDTIDCESFNHFQAKSHSAPAICFSPNPIHALCSASSFGLDSYTSLPSSKSSFIPTKERWIVPGPKEDLLLWIPVYLPLNLYNPSTTLVIPIGSDLQLDLSHLAHGTSWQMCREHSMNMMA